MQTSWLKRERKGPSGARPLPFVNKTSSLEQEGGRQWWGVKIRGPRLNKTTWGNSYPTSKGQRGVLLVEFTDHLTNRGELDKGLRPRKTVGRV